jgi:thiol-disulfide isomerase/thioredoxin
LSAVAAASGKAANWAALLVMLVLAMIAMAGVRMWGPAPSFDVVELHSREPASLSSIVDESGRQVSFDAFRGKTLILNLWAPWCAPCLKEMPSLDRLTARLPESEFAVVAVTKDALGDSPSKRTFDKLGLSRLKLYLDPQGRLPAEIGSRGFPTTLILGPNGAPLAFREGETAWDSDAVVARLDQLAARGRRAE